MSAQHVTLLQERCTTHAKWQQEKKINSKLKRTGTNFQAHIILYIVASLCLIHMHAWYGTVLRT